MATQENTKIDNLPRWAYASLALVAATVGLASSTVTAQFFVLGLERIEADPTARNILIATGMLMIVTELIAFGLAALLPKRQLRALRNKLIICGVMLLGFEAATIYITQLALIQATDATVTSTDTHIANLKTSIENRRATAKSLRENGALQSASTNAWTHTVGAGALREALKVDQQIEPLSAELATLQAAARPSMTTMLGANGMLAYSVARAMLISVMGLVMFGAAGALLREAGSEHASAPAAAATPSFKQSSAAQRYKGAMLAAGVPLAAMGAMGAAIAHPAPVAPAAFSTGVIAPTTLDQARFLAPAAPDQAQKVSETATKRVRSAVADGSKLDAGTSGNSATRYNRIKAAVVAGTLKPSIRAIQEEEGGGTLVVRRYLHKLEEEGVIVQKGQGWVRA